MVWYRMARYGMVRYDMVEQVNGMSWRNWLNNICCESTQAPTSMDGHLPFLWNGPFAQSILMGRQLPDRVLSTGRGDLQASLARTVPPTLPIQSPWSSTADSGELQGSIPRRHFQITTRNTTFYVVSKRSLMYLVNFWVRGVWWIWLIFG